MTRTCAIGVQLSGLVPTFVPDLASIPALVAELEAAGAADVLYGEHLLYAPDMQHPSGRPLGRTERSHAIADVLTLYGGIAAVTSTIRLVTGVVVAALHEPVLLAKQLASVDRLSRGRLVVGVGSGWSRPEFDAVGVAFDERFARMTEVVDACRVLWTSSPASFHGKWASFDDVVLEPGPVAAGGPPVWWGGTGSEVTARRVARAGAGWLVSEAADRTQIEAGVARLDAACERSGRDRTGIGVRATVTGLAGPGRAGLDELVERTVAGIDTLTGVGVTHVTLSLAAACENKDDAVALVSAVCHERGGR